VLLAWADHILPLLYRPAPGRQNYSTRLCHSRLVDKYCLGSPDDHGGRLTRPIRDLSAKKIRKQGFAISSSIDCWLILTKNRTDAWTVRPDILFDDAWASAAAAEASWLFNSMLDLPLLSLACW